jgi:exonuclease III
MKIITLNTWGGRIDYPFKKFLESNKEVDILCFQEVYHNAYNKDNIWTDGPNLNLFSDIKDVLSDYNSIYHPHLGDWWGLGLFFKKNIKVLSHGEQYVHKQKGYDLEKEVIGHTAKNIQYVNIKSGEKNVTIINFHGLWNGQGKTDTEDRIKQSENIVNFIKQLGTQNFVLCGDFNLSPDTKSIKMIEEGLNARNLVKEFNVTSTRTSYYTKENKFADYIFTGSGIVVKDFKVLPDEVSDHSPLFIEIE